MALAERMAGEKNPVAVEEEEEREREASGSLITELKDGREMLEGGNARWK